MGGRGGKRLSSPLPEAKAFNKDRKSRVESPPQELSQDAYWLCDSASQTPNFRNPQELASTWVFKEMVTEFPKQLEASWQPGTPELVASSTLTWAT